MLQVNLNSLLFMDIFNEILEKLKSSYNEFKESIDFLILKEDIRMQERLYEVLIEGKLISNH